VICRDKNLFSKKIIRLFLFVIFTRIFSLDAPYGQVILCHVVKKIQNIQNKTVKLLSPKIFFAQNINECYTKNKLLDISKLEIIKLVFSQISILIIFFPLI